MQQITRQYPNIYAVQMQNYGKVRNMFEPKLLDAGDIANLIEKIDADKSLHNWQKKDFENSLIDETRPIYICLLYTSRCV